jgi:putative PIN family toxin of toxin-antitoxin system
MKEKIRLVVDTNTWISTFLSATFYVRSRIFFRSNFQLLFSKKLFQEIDNTIHKRKFCNCIDLVQYKNFILFLQKNTEMVEVQSFIDICRDPKDNFLLALAKDGGADYLITGDKDLLTLKQYGKTKIVTVTEFENMTV